MYNKGEGVWHWEGEELREGEGLGQGAVPGSRSVQESATQLAPWLQLCAPSHTYMTFKHLHLTLTSHASTLANEC